MSRVFAFVVVLVFFVPRFADRGAIVVLQSASSFSGGHKSYSSRVVGPSSSFRSFPSTSSRGERFSRRLFFFFFFVLLRTIQFSSTSNLSSFECAVVAFSLSLPRKKKAPPPPPRKKKKEGPPLPFLFFSVRVSKSRRQRNERVCWTSFVGRRMRCQVYGVQRCCFKGNFLREDFCKDNLGS